MLAPLLHSDLLLFVSQHTSDQGPLPSVPAAGKALPSLPCAGRRTRIPTMVCLPTLPLFPCPGHRAQSPLVYSLSPGEGRACEAQPGLWLAWLTGAPPGPGTVFRLPRSSCSVHHPEVHSPLCLRLPGGTITISQMGKLRPGEAQWRGPATHRLRVDAKIPGQGGLGFFTRREPDGKT